MTLKGFIRKPKLMVKASKRIQARDCCNSDGGLVLKVCAKTKQLQTKEVRMPAIAIRKPDLLLFREKRVIRTHAARGENKAIQTK
jgi:hypothetical protein